MFLYFLFLGPRPPLGTHNSLVSVKFLKGLKSQKSHFVYKILREVIKETEKSGQADGFSLSLSLSKRIVDNSKIKLARNLKHFIVVVVVVVIVLVVVVVFSSRKFNLHAHTLDWCAFALVVGKKTDGPTDGRTRRFLE